MRLLDTKNLAQDILSLVSVGVRNGALVVALYGDLGAGKTTFMQFFGEALGVKEKILSPTFVIEKIYKIHHPKYLEFEHLIHIDAYRIENPKEMLMLGWNDIVKNPKNIICIEWADKIADLLPEDSVKINFSHYDKESRIITMASGL